MRSNTRMALGLVAWVGLSLGTAGCGTLTVEDEKQLGRSVQRQVRQSFTLMRDRVTVNYVRNFGEHLAESARPSPFEFRFYVVEDEDLNAFAVPGGAIYVNTGLIQAVDNASELAGVLAHEIGHVTARHTAQLYRRQRNTGVVAQFFAIIVAIATGNRYAANAGEMAAGLGAQAYLSTYTKEYERQADKLAVETLVAAGYDPHGMITMFETLQKEAGAGFRAPAFLSSHPATAERIQSVRQEIGQRGDVSGLRADDGGRLEIIKKRIELVMGTDIDEIVEDEEEDPDVEP